MINVTFDTGATRILLPMASVSDIPSIPGELFAKFQTSFYADPRDAAFKALGVERETIESYFGRPPDEWDDGHLEVMTEKHYAIKNSNITARDAFSDEIVLGQT